MIKFFAAILLSSIIFLNVNSQTSEVWMIGPMLHFNFNKKIMHTSFGLELSYWNYKHIPYSVDWGIEFQKKRIRTYSEAQTGIGLLGISTGPVLELRTDEHNLKAGIQGSVWANYFGGFDLRFRRTAGTTSLSPGLYFKLPLGAGMHSDGHHHHHWDWDD